MSRLLLYVRTPSYVVFLSADERLFRLQMSQDKGIKFEPFNTIHWALSIGFSKGGLKAQCCTQPRATPWVSRRQCCYALKGQKYKYIVLTSAFTRRIVLAQFYPRRCLGLGIALDFQPAFTIKSRRTNFDAFAPKMSDYSSAALHQ